MNNYYKSLELHKILEMLSAESSNEQTKKMDLELEPVSDIYTVKSEM